MTNPNSTPGVKACPSCLTTEPPILFRYYGLPMTRCPKCQIELNADGVSVDQPAHSKSEYKRRVAMGDPNVAPPLGVQEVDRG